MKSCPLLLGHVSLEPGRVVFTPKGPNHKNSLSYVDKRKFLCGEGMWYVQLMIPIKA